MKRRSFIKAGAAGIAAGVLPLNIGGFAGQAFARNPLLVQEFYNMRRAQLAEVSPNAAHFSLAELAARWKGEIQEDERDREIAAYSGGWGRGALSAVILGVAVMLAISPAEQLAWVTPLTVANLLIFALLWGSLVEHTTSAIRYWRDRA